VLRQDIHHLPTAELLEVVSRLLRRSLLQLSIEWCAISSHINLCFRDVVHHHARAFLHVGDGHLTLVLAIVLDNNLGFLDGGLSWVFGAATAPFAGFRFRKRGGCGNGRGFVVAARAVFGVGCAVCRWVVAAAGVWVDRGGVGWI